MLCTHGPRFEVVKPEFSVFMLGWIIKRGPKSDIHEFLVKASVFVIDEVWAHDELELSQAEVPKSCRCMLKFPHPQPADPEVPRQLVIAHPLSHFTMPSLSAVKASNQAWKPAFRPVVVVAGGTNGLSPDVAADSGHRSRCRNSLCSVRPKGQPECSPYHDHWEEPPRR